MAHSMCQFIKVSTNLTIHPWFLYIKRVKQMTPMDSYLSEQQVEELVNFDYVSEDLSDLIEEEKFNVNDYLNSNIDYWNELSYRYC